jgi:hypothetical protein
MIRSSVSHLEDVRRLQDLGYSDRANGARCAVSGRNKKFEPVLIPARRSLPLPPTSLSCVQDEIIIRDSFGWRGSIPERNQKLGLAVIR